jgi:hypothetical protein
VDRSVTCQRFRRGEPAVGTAVGSQVRGWGRRGKHALAGKIAAEETLHLAISANRVPLMVAAVDASYYSAATQTGGHRTAPAG